MTTAKEALDSYYQQVEADEDCTPNVNLAELNLAELEILRDVAQFLVSDLNTERAQRRKALLLAQEALIESQHCADPGCDCHVEQEQTLCCLQCCRCAGCVSVLNNPHTEED